MITNTIIALGFVLYIVFVLSVCMSLVFVCTHYYTSVTVLDVIPSVYQEWFIYRQATAHPSVIATTLKVMLQYCVLFVYGHT